MVNVNINTEEELIQATKDLLHVLVNLRHKTKIWHDQYGSKNLSEKKKWEQRADDLIEKLQAQRKHSSGEYHITVKTEQ